MFKKPGVFTIFGLFGPRRCPKLDCMGQEAPRRPLRGPQEAPGGPQRALRGAPNRDRERERDRERKRAIERQRER